MLWIKWMVGAWVANMVMLGALATGSYTDMRWRRLPNWLTFSLAGFGVVSQVGLRGVDGARDSLLGWLLGCALLFLPFALGGMGAGDVKLMGAIGALKGPTFVLNAFAYTAFFGGILALVLIIQRHGVLKMARRAGASLSCGIRGLILYRSAPAVVRMAIRPEGGLVPVVTEPEQKLAPLALPYGVAIAAGALLALMMGH